MIAARKSSAIRTDDRVFYHVARACEIEGPENAMGQLINFAKFLKELPFKKIRKRGKWFLRGGSRHRIDFFNIFLKILVAIGSPSCPKKGNKTPKIFSKPHFFFLKHYFVFTVHFFSEIKLYS